MQVARKGLSSLLDGHSSGERARNTWVTYPEHEDSPEKSGLILDKTTVSYGTAVNGGDPFGDLSVWERPMPYQLVGEVTAHQGYDGYRD